MKYFKIYRYKHYLIILLSIYSEASCHKNNTEKFRGNLNLSFKFTDKKYNIVNDTQCGCQTTTRPDLFAYSTPEITIKDTYGNIIYKKYGSEINLVNFPLTEGNYSIRYQADLIETTPCDSAMDIWKTAINWGATPYCINKNKYNYKNIDTVENITVIKKAVITVSRVF
jgi:hypothetical protein